MNDDDDDDDDDDDGVFYFPQCRNHIEGNDGSTQAKWGKWNCLRIETPIPSVGLKRASLEFESNTSYTRPHLPPPKYSYKLDPAFQFQLYSPDSSNEEWNCVRSLSLD